MEINLEDLKKKINCLYLRVQRHFLNRRVDEDLCKKVLELNRLGYLTGDIRKKVSRFCLF